MIAMGVDQFLDEAPQVKRCENQARSGRVQPVVHVRDPVEPKGAQTAARELGKHRAGATDDGPRLTSDCEEGVGEQPDQGREERCGRLISRHANHGDEVVTDRMNVQLSPRRIGHESANTALADGLEVVTAASRSRKRE